MKQVDPTPMILAPQLPEAVPEDATGTLDLRGLLLTLWRGKWIILICALITATLTFLALSRQVPTYKAEAMVMFDNSKTNVVNIQEVLVDPEFSKDTLQNEIEVLRSSNLIERVVDKLRLDRDPEFNPHLRVKETGLMERLFGDLSLPPEVTDLGQSLGLISPQGPSPDPVLIAERRRLDLINRVRASMELTPVRGSRVIRIGFVSEDPRTAARVVNTVSEQYIVDQLDAKLEATRSATEWLSFRVEELKDRVQESEDLVETTRARLAVDAGQSIELTRQQLDAASRDLTEAQAQTAELSAKYARLSDAVEAGSDLGIITEFRESRLIQSYRAEETELLQRIQSLSRTVSDTHPTLLRTRDQLTDIRSQIDREARNIIAAIKISMDTSSSKEAALAATVRLLEQKALEQSRSELELRQLEREAQASRLLYENFLGRLQETSEQEDLQSADARVLSPAQPPNRPQSQRKTQLLVLSAIIGGILGAGIVFLLDRLNNTFRGPAQVEEFTGLGVLASIPTIGRRLHRAEVISALRERPNSSLAEAIRNLRTSILFSNLDNPPKVVMFTSSVPREGKSTTSMLMALTSRQMGKSAIIVDCDLRLPALSKILKSNDDAPGLLSVMEGTAEIGEAIWEDPDTGLHVLMARSREKPGQINAADILSSQKFRTLVESLSETYDLVILDTPPVVVVSDARIVSKVADAVVYVVRWDDTPRGAVLEGLKELRTVGADITGVALTHVNESKAAKYSYQGYGYYKGRYKDYYTT